MTPEGLTSKDLLDFGELIIKANEEQLGLMSRKINDERMRRLPL